MNSVLHSRCSPKMMPDLSRNHWFDPELYIGLRARASASSSPLSSSRHYFFRRRGGNFRRLENKSRGCAMREIQHRGITI